MSRHRRAAPRVSAPAPTAPRLRKAFNNGPPPPGFAGTAGPLTGLPSPVRPAQPGAAYPLREARRPDHRGGAPAVRLRQRGPGPAELGHLLPRRLALAAWVVREGAHGGGRHVLVEERARRVLQELLVGAEREVHSVTPSGGRRALPWAGRGRVRR